VGAGGGPTTNGGGISASVCADNFTICGVDGSVVVPPPQAASATIDSNVKIFLMRVSFMLGNSLRKSSLSRP
jgi:hypothetical protein